MTLVLFTLICTCKVLEICRLLSCSCVVCRVVSWWVYKNYSPGFGVTLPMSAGYNLARCQREKMGSSHVMLWRAQNLLSTLTYLSITSRWFQPIWKIFVKLDHFPIYRGEHKNYLKPPPSFSCFSLISWAMKKTWLFKVYAGLYYLVMWGL